MTENPDDAALEIAVAIAQQLQPVMGSWVVRDSEYRVQEIDLGQGPGRIIITRDRQSGDQTVRDAFLIDVRHLTSVIV